MAEVTSRNNSSSNLPLILEKIDQAISTASEAKADHDRAKQESAELLMNKIDLLFKPPQNSQQPPDQPSPLSQP